MSGAEALSRRIAEHENWREALAVRIGEQPPRDPDGEALESFRLGVRYYRSEPHSEVLGGRVVITSRFCKRLVDGTWKTEVIFEADERVA